MSIHFHLYSLISYFFIAAVQCSDKDESSEHVLRSLGSMRMRNFHASKCQPNYDYLATVENVEMDIEGDESINLSGSMFVKSDLITPIEAQVTLYMNTVFGRVKMPCIGNFGTCFYNDLCSFGYPSSRECPSHFKEDEVPCRCPITKGNYTLSPSYQLSSGKNLREFFIPATYTGTLNVATGNTEISCYNFGFQLYSGIEDEEAKQYHYEVILVD